MDISEVLTITEVSRKLNVSRQAVYTAIKTKRLIAKKLGFNWYTTEEMVKEYIKGRYSRKKSIRTNGDLLFDNSKGFYSICQLADVVKCSPQRLYYLVRKRQIKYEKFHSVYVIKVGDMDEMKKIIFSSTYPNSLDLNV